MVYPVCLLLYLCIVHYSVEITLDNTITCVNSKSSICTHNVVATAEYSIFSNWNISMLLTMLEDLASLSVNMHSAIF